MGDYGKRHKVKPSQATARNDKKANTPDTVVGIE